MEPKVVDFFQEWIKHVTTLLVIIAPCYLSFKKIASDYHERCLKRDTEAIREIAKATFKSELHEIQKKYIEIQEMIRSGEFK